MYDRKKKPLMSLRRRDEPAVLLSSEQAKHMAASLNRKSATDISGCMVQISKSANGMFLRWSVRALEGISADRQCLKKRWRMQAAPSQRACCPSKNRSVRGADRCFHIDGKQRNVKVVSNHGVVLLES